MDMDFDNGVEHWCPVCNASYMVERYASYSWYERILREWGSLVEYFEHHSDSEVDVQLAQAVAQTLSLWPGDRVPFYGWLDDDDHADNREEWNKALMRTLHLFDIPELYPDPIERGEQEEFSFDWIPLSDDEDVVRFLICPECSHIVLVEQ